MLQTTTLKRNLVPEIRRGQQKVVTEIREQLPHLKVAYVCSLHNHIGFFKEIPLILIYFIITMTQVTTLHQNNKIYSSLILPPDSQNHFVTFILFFFFFSGQSQEQCPISLQVKHCTILRSFLPGLTWRFWLLFSPILL